MATWDTSLVIIFRNLINDAVAPYTYNDARAKEIILVGAQLMLMEVSFDIPYVVDLNGQNITPDPVENNDNNFIALHLIKPFNYLPGAGSTCNQYSCSHCRCRYYAWARGVDTRPEETGCNSWGYI